MSNFPKAFYRLREKLDPALQSLLTYDRLPLIIAFLI